MNLVKIAVLSAAVIFGGFAANASTINLESSCGELNIDLKVVDNSGENLGCDVGSTGNDFLNVETEGGSALQVNVDEMFDVSSWEYIARDNDLGDGEFTGSFEISNTSWAITGGAYEYYMIVLKAGGENTTPSSYVGYLFSGTGELEGTVMSPFLNPNGGTQSLSHGTLYGFGEISQIPVPAAGFLLLAGLGGLAAMRRRK